MFALLAILAPPVAAAAGPVAGSDAGPSGVTMPGDAGRYVALPVGDRTLIERIDDQGVSNYRSLPGRLVIPTVAMDGSATGLSADSGTLVLVAGRSAFTVFETGRLRRVATIRLRGDFTLDAISPDGQLLYLIEATSRQDATRYAVRAYDVEARRLLPDPVIDPAEADEPMRGLPLTRAYSPDGRWAYTLYDDSGGEHPFIHALDTETATAKCIDLDRLTGRGDYAALSLRIGPGGTIQVRHTETARTLLVVDPASFAVSEPRRSGAAPKPVEDGDGGSTWLIVAAGLVLLALAGALARRARRHRAHQSKGTDPSVLLQL
jgi:MYXO-CTERM domain-containing protein